ncbi:hypothetical protein PFICI_00045 [Pestalotiopsis fici W106-1]|uniref:Uncharacterized protein n=1 Tax=Pestalotiopsis fici (strain W106-1 / CGMCC3.15140) TaxID=1229662 RepID=W3XL72_PESFW|nr:uncharacterized protein PFICI_00045 [Pestalotiopsis fici W106-1]ETS86217.1 hypothetical protein PFICI_00045 [Pestalotiopsis fici W106-1]
MSPTVDPDFIPSTKHSHEPSQNPVRVEQAQKKKMKRKPKAQPKTPAKPAGPITSWEAVWLAYHDVRAKYPRLHNTPTSPHLRVLLNLPAVRELRFNEHYGRRHEFSLATTTPTKNRNLKAALTQASAELSEQTCTRCANHKNPWDVCVGGLGCAGCTYNGQRFRCCLPEPVPPSENQEIAAESSGGLVLGHMGSTSPLRAIAEESLGLFHLRSGRVLSQIASEVPGSSDFEDQPNRRHTGSSEGHAEPVLPTTPERRRQIQAMTDTERMGALRIATLDLRLLYEVMLSEGKN